MKKMSEKEYRALRIADLEKRIEDRESYEDLIARYLNVIDETVKKAKDVWRRHGNLSPSTQAAQTRLALTGLSNHVTALECCLQEMERGDNREKERQEAILKLAKLLSSKES